MTFHLIIESSSTGLSYCTHRSLSTGIASSWHWSSLLPNLGVLISLMHPDLGVWLLLGILPNQQWQQRRRLPSILILVDWSMDWEARAWPHLSNVDFLYYHQHELLGINKLFCLGSNHLIYISFWFGVISHNSFSSLTKRYFIIDPKGKIFQGWCDGYLEELLYMSPCQFTSQSLWI